MEPGASVQQVLGEGGVGGESGRELSTSTEEDH